MNNLQVGILIQAFAVNARIESMKAENTRRVQQDNSIAYDEGPFHEAACELEQLARDAARVA